MLSRIFLLRRESPTLPKSTRENKTATHIHPYSDCSYLTRHSTLFGDIYNSSDTLRRKLDQEEREHDIDENSSLLPNDQPNAHVGYIARIY